MIDFETSLQTSRLTKILEKLEDKELEDKIQDAATEIYYSKIMEYIDSGRSFTPRTGNLQHSIGFDVNKKGFSSLFSTAFYAPYVEFGTKIAAAYPFFYAGRDARLKAMQEKAAEVIKEAMA